MKWPLFIFALTTLAVAQTAQPEAEQFIRDLTATDWAKRQQAEDSLVGAGAPAIDAINAALATSTDFEQRDRLQSALARIGREQLLIATPVTVNGRFERPLDAYTALARLVDLPTKCENPDAEARATAAVPVDLDFTDKPWLEALTETVARTNVNIRLEDEKLTLLRVPPAAIRRPTHFAGAISISADNARRRQATDLASGNTTSSLQVRLAAMCEPKIKFRAESMRLMVSKLLDQNGESILGDAQRVVPMQRESGGRYTCTLNFNTAKNAPTAISLIEGDLVGEIITRTIEARVEDLTALPQTLETPAGTIEISSLVRTGKNWSLAVQISRETNFHQSLANGLATDTRDGLHIVDQFGEPMRVNLTAQSMAQATVDVTFTLSSTNSDAQPAKLLWNIASQSRDIRIPFVLRDLPMPN